MFERFLRRRYDRRPSEIGKVHALERQHDVAGLTELLRRDRHTAAAASALRRIGEPMALSALVDAYLDDDFPGDHLALAEILHLAMVPRLPLSVRPKYLARDAAAEARRLILGGDINTALTLLSAIGDGAEAVEASSSGTVWDVAPHAQSAAGRAAATIQRMQMWAKGFITRPDKPYYSIAYERVDLFRELVMLDALLSTLPEELAMAEMSVLVEGEGVRQWVFQLIRLVEGGGPLVRRIAIEQLSRLGDPAAIPALRDCLHEDDPEMRYAAIAALTVLGGLTSIDDLEEALEDRHWAIRLAAVAAVRRLDGSEAIDALHARLDDDHYEVRMAALAIAARIDRRVLRRGVEDPNEEVRTHAAMVASDLE